MGYLLHVKERQATTDEMFEPIRETINLLKMYEVELPEEVNVFLQVSVIQFLTDLLNLINFYVLTKIL